MQPIIRYPADIAPRERRLGSRQRTYWRIYGSRADRQRAISQLMRAGFCYFLRYTDLGRPALEAVQARPAWLPAPRIWVD